MMRFENCGNFHVFDNWITGLKADCAVNNNAIFAKRNLQ